MEHFLRRLLPVWLLVVRITHTEGDCAGVLGVAAFIEADVESALLVAAAAVDLRSTGQCFIPDVHAAAVLHRGVVVNGCVLLSIISLSVLWPLIHW